MTVHAGLDFTDPWPYLPSAGIKIPELTCSKGDTLDIYFLITSWNCDKKIMKPITISSAKLEKLLLE